MKKLIFLLLLFAGIKGYSQNPVKVTQPQDFLTYIWVKDSVRATIYFQGTNDTLATQAYVRAHMGAGSSGIAGFGIKISNDSFSVDTTKLVKQDSMWVVNDTTFIIKINSRLTTFHMRGGVVSYNGRVGAIVSNPADYSAFYVSLTGSYNSPVWLNSLTWAKLTGVPSTILGYGIVDAVTNLGGSATWASGTFAARPSPGNPNGAFYLAKDTNAIYFDNGAAWQKIVGGPGGPDSGIVATNGILKTIASTTITLKADTSLLATRYDIARDSAYNAATFYTLTNPSAYINLTSISNLPPILYNPATGVISADTSTGPTHLATQAFVNAQTDTSRLHPIGTGSPMIQTLFAGLGGDLRTSRWGPGLYTIPHLASDSLAYIDLDTTSIGYKAWIIAQYGPGTGSQKPTLDSVLQYGDTAFQKNVVITWDPANAPYTQHPFYNLTTDSANGSFSVGDVNGNRTNFFLIMSQKAVGIEADSGFVIKAGGNTQFTYLQTQAGQTSTIQRLRLPFTGNLIDTLATKYDIRSSATPPNLGSAYRIYAPQTPGFKTLNCTGCLLDSATTGQIGITVTDASISTSNITTNNVSITKHGWAPIAPNDATKYLDGTGAWSTPPGGGLTVSTAPNTANYTVPSGRRIFVYLSDLTGQANRNAVLPTPTTGDEFIFTNLNTSASTFLWTFTNGTVKDFGQNTITTVPNLTVVHMVFGGTNFQIIN